MADRLYATPNAGINNYTLFEELSEYSDNASGGYVLLRKTCMRKLSDGEREYPPVYAVIYHPSYWARKSREFMSDMWAIADRHEAKVQMAVEDNQLVLRFEHS